MYIYIYICICVCVRVCLHVCLYITKIERHAYACCLCFEIAFFEGRHGVWLCGRAYWPWLQISGKAFAG